MARDINEILEELEQAHEGDAMNISALATELEESVSGQALQGETKAKVLEALGIVEGVGANDLAEQIRGKIKVAAAPEKTNEVDPAKVEAVQKEIEADPLLQAVFLEENERKALDNARKASGMPNFGTNDLKRAIQRVIHNKNFFSKAFYELEKVASWLVAEEQTVAILKAQMILELKQAEERATERKRKRNLAWFETIRSLLEKTRDVKDSNQKVGIIINDLDLETDDRERLQRDLKKILAALPEAKALLEKEKANENKAEVGEAIRIIFAKKRIKIIDYTIKRRLKTEELRERRKEKNAHRRQEERQNRAENVRLSARRLNEYIESTDDKSTHKLIARVFGTQKNAKKRQHVINTYFKDEPKDESDFFEDFHTILAKQKELKGKPWTSIREGKSVSLSIAIAIPELHEMQDSAISELLRAIKSDLMDAIKKTVIALKPESNGKLAKALITGKVERRASSESFDLNEILGEESGSSTAEQTPAAQKKEKKHKKKKKGRKKDRGEVFQRPSEGPGFLTPAQLESRFERNEVLKLVYGGDFVAMEEVQSKYPNVQNEADLKARVADAVNLHFGMEMVIAENALDKSHLLGIFKADQSKATQAFVNGMIETIDNELKAEAEEEMRPAAPEKPEAAAAAPEAQTPEVTQTAPEPEAVEPEFDLEKDISQTAYLKDLFGEKTDEEKLKKIIDDLNHDTFLKTILGPVADPDKVIDSDSATVEQLKAAVREVLVIVFRVNCDLNRVLSKAYLLELNEQNEQIASEDHVTELVNQVCKNIWHRLPGVKPKSEAVPKPDPNQAEPQKGHRAPSQSVLGKLSGDLEVPAPGRSPAPAAIAPVAPETKKQPKFDAINTIAKTNQYPKLYLLFVSGITQEGKYNSLQREEGLNKEQLKGIIGFVLKAQLKVELDPDQILSANYLKEEVISKGIIKSSLQLAELETALEQAFEEAKHFGGTSSLPFPNPIPLQSGQSFVAQSKPPFPSSLPTGMPLPAVPVPPSSYGPFTPPAQASAPAAAPETTGPSEAEIMNEKRKILRSLGRRKELGEAIDLLFIVLEIDAERVKDNEATPEVEKDTLIDIQDDIKNQLGKVDIEELRRIRAVERSKRATAAEGIAAQIVGYWNDQVKVDLSEEMLDAVENQAAKERLAKAMGKQEAKKSNETEAPNKEQQFKELADKLAKLYIGRKKKNKISKMTALVYEIDPSKLKNDQARISMAELQEYIMNEFTNNLNSAALDAKTVLSESEQAEYDKLIDRVYKRVRKAFKNNVTPHLDEFERQMIELTIGSLEKRSSIPPDSAGQPATTKESQPATPAEAPTAESQPEPESQPAAPAPSEALNSVPEDSELLRLIESHKSIPGMMNRLEKIRKGLEPGKRQRFEQRGAAPEGFKEDLDAYLRTVDALLQEGDPLVSSYDKHGLIERYLEQLKWEQPDLFSNWNEGKFLRKMNSYLRSRYVKVNDLLK